MDIQIKAALITSIFAIIAAILTISGNFIFTNNPPVVDDLTPDPASPQVKGSQIIWIATAHDPDKDIIYYKFQLKGPSTNNIWVDEQEWSTINKWTWNTSDLDIGNNIIQVRIMDKKHGVSDEGDDRQSIPYSVIDSAIDWYNKGKVFFNQKRYDDALTAYNKTIELDPSYELAWRNKGEALFGLGRYEEAIKACDETIKLSPSDISAWVIKGFALEAIGDYEAAVKAHEGAIEIDPSCELAWGGKGEALFDLGKYKEAIVAYDKLIELDQSRASAWYKKGHALSNMHEYEDALKAYNKTIELDPLYELAWRGKGDMLYILGSFEDAISAYDRAIELNQSDAIAWYSKGNAIKAQSHDLELADICFGKAKELGYKG